MAYSIQNSLFALLIVCNVSIPCVQPIHNKKESLNTQIKTPKKKKSQLAQDITISGNIILTIGSIGLLFAGLYHINSRVATFPKDRFVSQEIRNLLLKAALPVLAIGGVVTFIGKKLD